MKKLVLLALFSVTLSFMSCSNNEPQTKQEVFLPNKDGSGGTPIDVNDVNYTTLNNFSNYVVEKYTYINEKNEVVWVEPSTEELQLYFDVNFPDETKDLLLYVTMMQEEHFMIYIL